MFSNLSRDTNFDEKDTCQVDISMTGKVFLTRIKVTVAKSVSHNGRPFGTWHTSLALPSKTIHLAPLIHPCKTRGEICQANSLVGHLY